MGDTTNPVAPLIKRLEEYNLHDGKEINVTCGRAQPFNENDRVSLIIDVLLPTHYVVGRCTVIAQAAHVGFELRGVESLPCEVTRYTFLK